MLRAFCVELRSNRALFGELLADPDDQFSDLMAVVRAWITSKRFTTGYQTLLNGQKVRVSCGEHRLGLLPIVTQTLNNYACSAGGYG
jgi:hypothetical protein